MRRRVNQFADELKLRAVKDSPFRGQGGQRQTGGWRRKWSDANLPAGREEEMECSSFAEAYACAIAFSVGARRTSGGME